LKKIFIKYILPTIDDVEIFWHSTNHQNYQGYDMNSQDVQTLKALRFKALSEITRLKMIPHLSEPRTVKQVADQLGLDHHSLYHHMHVLEKSGIVQMVKTRKVGNITEKYYQLVDNWVVMPETDGKTGEMNPLVRQTAFAILEDMDLSLQAGKENAVVHRVFLSISKENLPNLKRSINKAIQEMIESIIEIEDVNGELTYSLNFLHFLTPESVKKMETN
jgi:DNA-binding transcriptional ArsR family regulator